MAAYVSPTPAAFACSFSNSRRPHYRTATRPVTNRAQPMPQTISTERKSHLNRDATGDSSDDEDLAPIKLSAEAQAILGEDNSQSGAEKENWEPQIRPARTTSSSKRRS